jgi:peptide/nickel transport system substrate-binding protein
VFPAVCVRPGTGPGEAGFGIPAGTRLSLLLRMAKGRVALNEMMERYRQDAAEAGIELRLQEVVGSILVAEDGPGPGTPGNPPRWELSNWNGGWVYNLPTGENLFAGSAAANLSNYADERADELIAATVAGDDLDALYAYQEYIADQCPVIFMPGFPQRLLEVASNLRGVAPLNPYAMLMPENWYYVEEES